MKIYTSLEKLKASKYYIEYQGLEYSQKECNKLATTFGNRIVDMAIERGFKLNNN